MDACRIRWATLCTTTSRRCRTSGSASSMSAILLKSLLTFLCTVFLHIAVWRVHRPLSYRVWVPALIGIFVVGGGLIAAMLVVTLKLPDDAVVNEPFVEWCAVALLQAAVGVVYTFGYTLLLVGSPSLV